MIIIKQHLSAEAADAYALVLTAEGIPYRAVKGWAGWSILVAESDGVRAIIGIEQYRLENPEAPLPEDVPATRALRQASWCGVWAAAALLGIHLATASSTAGHAQIIAALGASADRILGGEWLRCATALLIHADAPHLVGNMVGLAIFAGAVCGVSGAGVGALMIAASGIVGNLLNAILYQSHHLSVGASTAVFGAVGILVAHQLQHGIKRYGGAKWRAFLPLGAGLALLGFLSSGPRVDIMAHLFGMVAGGLMGAAYGLRQTRPPARSVQVVCAVIVLGVFAGAWMATLKGVSF